MTATAAHTITRLPMLVLDPFARCNCRCQMCDIWQRTASGAMPLADVERHVDALLPAGLRWVTLTGGEPLMHPQILDICRTLKHRGLRVTLLSSGLLVERFAAPLAGLIDDLIVSLDGPAAIHDHIRGVPGAFDALSRGVASLRLHDPQISIQARTTVQRANHAALRDTVLAAQALSLDSLSFLAADFTSPAFGRSIAWPTERRAALALLPREVETLDGEIAHLIASGLCGRFIRESPAKLLRIVQHFRAALTLTQPVAPICNAPWVSAVVDSTGAVRPCFFHPPIGHTSESASLLDLLNSPRALAFRQTLDVATNATCRRCVCSLHWKGD